MRNYYISRKIAFDKAELSPLWAAEHVKVKGDSLLAFVGPSQNSKAMLHFIYEKFNTTTVETKLFFRLFQSAVREALDSRVERVDHDFYFERLPLTQSALACDFISGRFYLGFYLSPEMGPTGCVGLKNLSIREESFAFPVMQAFTREANEILAVGEPKTI